MTRAGVQAMTLTLLAVLVVLTLWPGLAAPTTLTHGDKLAHGAFYAATAGLAVLGWPPRPGVIVSGLTLLGAAIELAQRHIPGRGFEWMDLAANGAGIALGTGLAFAALRLRPLRFLRSEP